MNGDATGHGVIAAANAKNVPVIVISGSGFADAVQADEPRAALYFEKPVNPEALVNAVDELLRSRAWPRAEQLGKFSSPLKWRCYANNDFHRVFWAMKMFSEERFIVWFSVGLVLVCGIVIGYYRLARYGIPTERLVTSQPDQEDVRQMILSLPTDSEMRSFLERGDRGDGVHYP